MNNATRETYMLSNLDRNDLIAELYNRYGRKLYSYAARTWQLNEDEAWDLVYKTLYKVIDTYRKYTFESEEKFASFVFRVFINYLRNHYRDTKKHARESRDNSLDIDLLKDKGDDMNEEGQSVKMKLLREELDGMEDWQRILLLMRSDGRPYSEIAAYVEKPEEQLKVYYQRLKKKLTDRINEQI